MADVSPGRPTADHDPDSRARCQGYILRKKGSSMMKRVKTFCVDDMGIEHSQYFQGYGVAFTPYTDCAYGIGDTPKEALDDCLGQIACSGDVDTEDLEKRILAEYPDFAEADPPSVSEEYPDEGPEGEDASEIYWHIGIKWTMKD